MYKLSFTKKGAYHVKQNYRLKKKLNYWEKLKELLISEFGLAYNWAELHKFLLKRKVTDNESLDEYCLINYEAKIPNLSGSINLTSN